MLAIKLVIGVTRTCWRPPYGDIDDRIRYIANQLGLQTIIWKYDSFDWRVGTVVQSVVGNSTINTTITTATVDADHGLFISNASAGMFDTVGGIMLTHELNNFTMQEAINWYSRLNTAFKYTVPIGVALNKTKEANYSSPTFQQYISGQTNIAKNSSSSGSGARPSSRTSASAGNKKSFAATIRVSSGNTLWTLLLAGMLPSVLMI